MIQNAIDKLTEELKSFKGGQAEKVISKDVAHTLMGFCKQEVEFAEAVVQSDKTLSDCCDEIIKGNRTGISDIDAYKKAVAFYFPGAGVKVEMQINLCDSVENGEPQKGKIIKMSLDDLLDL